MHALPTTEAVGLSLFGVMTVYMLLHYWSSRYSGLTWRIRLVPSQTEGVGWSLTNRGRWLGLDVGQAL
jgi:hypothetical protein